MKRLLIAAITLLGFTAASFAQTAPAIKKQKTHAVSKSAVKKDATATAPAPAAAATTTPANAPVKKDGTPDLRYKANKNASTAHVKKDGTADKRFKENKKPS